MKDNANYTNADEACEALECSRAYLYKLEKMGKLHPVREGGRVFYSRDEIDSLAYEKIRRRTESKPKPTTSSNMDAY